MNTKQFRRAASAIAAATLLAGVMAVPVSAAVPTATSGGTSWDYAGDGWAGFEATYDYGDSSTLSRLYLEADITNGSSVAYLSATRNGSATNVCSVQASPLAVKCLFKTIRFGDQLVIRFGVVPADRTLPVTAEPLWSSTGYVPGGNNSHGDAWDEAGVLVSSPSTDPNLSEGFGNASLNTSTLNFGGNRQAVTLKNLPNGKFASVNDNGALAPSGFNDIVLNVNDGEAATFQLVIVYPKGTSAPKSFTHTSAGYATKTYNACQRGQSSECFTWSNKTNTVTLFLLHNGSIRRSG